MSPTYLFYALDKATLVRGMSRYDYWGTKAKRRECLECVLCNLAMSTTNVSDADIVVSVVVVAKNEEKHIASCIESLLAQDYPQEFYEIIVVDGCSTDRTQEIVRSYPVKLIIADRGIIGYQRNIGAMTAKGKYVAFTDADCVVSNQWLAKLVEALGNSPTDVVAVGGPNLVLDSDPIFARVIGYMQETLLGSGGSPQSYRMNKPKYVYSVPNCNIAYVADTLRSEKYDDKLSVGDDGDINYRLKQKGYRFLYLPDALVWHHRPINLKRFMKKMFSYGDGMGKVTRKNRGVVRWYAFAPILMGLVLLVAYPMIRFVPWAAYFYLAIAFIYMGGLFISTVQVFQRLKSMQSAKTLILLPVQHISYGFGFLKGMLLP